MTLLNLRLEVRWSNGNASALPVINRSAVNLLHVSLIATCLN